MHDKTVSWPSARQLTEELARKIRSDYEPDVIVGIMNGGGTVASLLGQYLGAKGVLCIPIEHYRPMTRETSADGPRQVVAANPDVRDRNVLVVDDIADSGKTLQFAAGLFEKDARDVRTAVLHCRSNLVCTVPNYYVEDVHPFIRYVYYPWEVKRLADAIQARG